MAETPTTTTTKSTPPAGLNRSKQPTLFLLFVGAGMLALWTVAFITQIQTNEAWILHQGEVSVFQPDWSILLQIPALLIPGLRPPYTSDEAIAIIVAYAIEFVYLGCIAGYELMRDSVHHSSGHTMAKVFRVLSWIMILFNGYTDYQYGTIGSGVIGHLAFAACVSLIVGYFGTIGLYLFRHVWDKA